MVLDIIKENYGDRDSYWYEESIPDKTNGWTYQGSLGVADTHGWLYPDIYSNPEKSSELAVSVSEITLAGYKVELVDMDDKSTIEEIDEFHGGYTEKKGITGLTDEGMIEVHKEVPNYEQKMYFWKAVNRAIEWMEEHSPSDV